MNKSRIGHILPGELDLARLTREMDTMLKANDISRMSGGANLLLIRPEDLRPGVTYTVVPGRGGLLKEGAPCRG